MPEATFLHIQTRETRQPRVMELSGASVRVGRGAQCEVRLNESVLADVQCLLRRRGATWHIQPVGPAGRVSIDGRPVDHQRPLPLGTPIRVGSHWLTLRRVGATANGFGSYEAPIPIEPRSVYEAPITPRTSSPLGEHEYASPSPPTSGSFSTETPEGDETRLKRWKNRLEQRERWLKSRQEERRWEARWKAFGETLRNRGAAASPSSPTPTPQPDLPVNRVVEPPAEPLTPTRDRDPHDPSDPARPSTSPESVTPEVADEGDSRDQNPSGRPAVHPTLETQYQRPTSTPGGGGKHADRPAEAPPLIRPWEPRPEDEDAAVESDVVEAHAEAPAPVEPENAGASIELGTSRAGLEIAPTVASEAASVEPGPPTAPIPSEAEGFLAGERPPEPAPAEPPGTDDSGRSFHDNAAPSAETSTETSVTRSEPDQVTVAATAGRDNAVSSGPAPAHSVGRDTSADVAPAPAGARDPNSVVTAQAERVPSVSSTGNAVRAQEPQSRPQPDRLTPAPASEGTEAAGGHESQALEDPHPFHWPRASSFVAHTSEALVGRWRHEAPIVPDDHPHRNGFPAADEPIHESEWPSAKAILAAHAGRASAEPGSTRRPTKRESAAPKRSSGKLPKPTLSQPPSQWSLPAWLAAVPAVAVVLVLGAVGLRLSWTWSRDDFAAGLVANRLLHADPIPPGALTLPDAPDPTWWSSTPEHIHMRAMALSRAEKDATQEERVRFLLHTARNAAPIDPSVRLALAEVPDPASPEQVPMVVGLSRDIVSLRKTAQNLLARGKTEEAVAVARQAIEIGTRIELARAAFPVFVDDSSVHRFRLPYEDSIEGVVHDLLAHPGWRWSDWSKALPPNGIAPLVAYRLMLEANDPDADAALRMVHESRIEAEGPVAEALLLAAQAEAFALSVTWQQAADKYREAIDVMPDDLIRRTWWINLGEIAGRLRNVELMRKAWASARGPSPKDEINTRMVEGRVRYGLDSRVPPTTKSGVASRPQP